MLTDILTVQDLENFKQTLFTEMRQMILEMNGLPNRQWIKTHELRKMLGLSQGSLQNLRLNGMLPFARIGGIIYYSLDDVNAMLMKQREVGSRSPFSLEKQSKKGTKKNG